MLYSDADKIIKYGVAHPDTYGGFQTSWHRADLTRFELGLSTTSGSRYDIISGEES
jgi:hypothetical protein